MNQLKQVAMVDYDPVKEDACFSFYTRQGNHKKLWVNVKTYRKLVGPKKDWDDEKMGAITMYQTELVNILKNEVSEDLVQWFDKETNRIMQAKTAGVK
jgi:hypothetical protein